MVKQFTGYNYLTDEQIEALDAKKQREQERETAYQLNKLRFTFFVAELALLSRKYGVAIQSTGGVCFGDFEGIEYSTDASSGDLTFNI